MTRPTANASSRLLALLRRCVDRVRGPGMGSHDALELRGMSDHQLKDLGIGRSEVQEWSRRGTPTVRPGTHERTALRALTHGAAGYPAHHRRGMGAASAAIVYAAPCSSRPHSFSSST